MAGTFGDMVSRIDDELIRGGADNTRIQNEILTAIKHYEIERFWFNEGVSTSTTTAGQGTLAVPTDLIEIDDYQVTVSGRPRTIDPLDWATFLREGGTDPAFKGQPRAYCYYADQFWLLPIPDNAYVLTLSYVKQLAALVNQTDGNAWMTFGEELIRARASAAVAIRYLKDADAIAEARTFQAGDRPVLCGLEEQALSNLRARSNRKVMTGRVHPIAF